MHPAKPMPREKVWQEAGKDALSYEASVWQDGSPLGPRTQAVHLSEAADWGFQGFWFSGHELEKLGLRACDGSIFRNGTRRP